MDAKRLNARQFFDVWGAAVQGAACALWPNPFPVGTCRWAVKTVVAHVHGDEVSTHATVYFDRLLMEYRAGRMQ